MRLETKGDGLVPKDDVSSTQLAVLVEEDLRPKYSILIIAIDQVKVRDCKVFICNIEKEETVRNKNKDILLPKKKVFIKRKQIKGRRNFTIYREIWFA